MEEVMLWIARAAIGVIGLLVVGAIIRFTQVEEDVDRERFDDKDEAYLKQKKQIGNAFGVGHVVPRWQMWLGAALPFLLFALVWLLSR